MEKVYNLFLSHSWSYSDAYDNLIAMLDGAVDFNYRNYSVPKSDPIHTSGTDQELHQAIKNKIAHCHAVLILAGVYSSYSKWIDREISICTSEFSSKKPIIAIEPWGAARTSQLVKDNADLVVRWNTRSIIQAVRKVSL